MKKIVLILIVCIPLLSVAQEGAYLGIGSLHISKKKAKILGYENLNGKYIARIMPNTPAAKSDLQAFDYIYAINNEEFSGSRDFEDIMDELNPGYRAKFSFIRDGKPMEKMIEVGEREHRQFPRRSKEEDPFLGVEANHLEMPKGVTGVAIDVVNCSTAEELNLKDDDIITKIDGIQMLDWNDLHYAIEDRAVGEEINVEYYRAGQTYQVSTPIKSLAATQACEQELEEQEEMEKELEKEVPVVVATKEEVEPIEAVSEVDMEPITEAEAEEMKREKGVNMPIVNNLSIEALQLFPNPTSGIFDLRFDLPNAGITVVRLFDANAKLLYIRELGLFTGSFNEQIDISNEVKGIYFLEIRQDELSLSRKVILQ